jgi:hypothetical protein
MLHGSEPGTGAMGGHFGVNKNTNLGRPFPKTRTNFCAPRNCRSAEVSALTQKMLIIFGWYGE